MSMVGNIMNAFTGGGNVAGKPPAAAPVAASSNATPPANNGVPPGSTPPPKADPLAAFEKVFDNTPDNNAPKAPSFKLAPEVLQKASESLDFSDVVPKDFKERFDQNDPSAMTDLINGLARKLYSTTLDHTSTLTDRFVNQRSEHDRRGLGSEVTKTLAKNNLRTIADKSPVAAKQIEQIQEQILSKHPDATPEFIQKQTEDYFRQIALVLFPDLAELNPAVQDRKRKDTELVGDTDWSKW